jgi:hypothetical protein
MFTSEVEQENSFINRIKNKIKVLQMYSSSPANDLFYVGSSFDSTDYIDYSRIESTDILPTIDNGQMSLSKVTTSPWTPQRVFIEETSSNGIAGNNHSVYASATDNPPYRYFFQDSPTSRNINNVIDNNPLTFFEYEQINIPTARKPSGNKNFEFQYIKSLYSKTSTGEEIQEEYYDWSTFSVNDLQLVTVLESDRPEKANFINIIPYFGSNNYISKDIKIEKIEVKNDLNQVENILTEAIYISSGLIPSSLDSARRFFYKEANIKFMERKVKSIKIFFKQLNYNDAKIQHIYFEPVKSKTRAGGIVVPENVESNPFFTQMRFNPDDPTVAPSLGYPSISWSQKIWNHAQITPLFNQPNLFKSETNNSIDFNITLKRNIPVNTGWTLRATGTDGKTYYVTNNFILKFKYDTVPTPQYYLEGLSGITNTGTNPTYSGYITVVKPYNNTVLAEGWMANKITTTNGITTNESQVEAAAVVNWFNTTSQGFTKQQKYDLFKLRVDSITAELINTDATKVQTKSYTIPLERKFDFIDGQRKSISLRDITVGYEEFSDKAQIVSKQFDFNSPIEYLTLSAEAGLSGQLSANVNLEYIKYYISLDGGSSWIRVSPIESPLSEVGEVLAFNQNVDNTFKIPGVEYYNAPTVPENPKSLIVKIDIEKPSGENISPILYSYKVGVKVRNS